MPPLRIAPERVGKLGVRQIGDRLVLSMPRPKSRTDDTALGPDSRIEMMMTLADPPPKRAHDIELKPALTWTIPYSEWSAYEQGTRIDVWLDLERIATGIELQTGAAGLRGKKLSFIAEVVESPHERSEPSDIETIDVCQPPSSPAATAARITEDGILIDWIRGEPGMSSASSGTGTKFGIYRRQKGEPRPDAVVATVTTGAVWLDSGATIGRQYQYVIRESAATGHCESADSPQIVATRVDLFPPAPPMGLAAVAEHGAIRLFWRPGRESDLRGYRVYRADGADKPWHVLTTEDLSATSYTDEDVIPGVVYSYAVTARDGADPVNESAWSDPAVETLKASEKDSRQ